MKNELHDFGVKIGQLASLIGLDLSPYQLDHVAMRINDHKLALAAHRMWAKQGRVISHAQINGRPIIVLELDAPLDIGGWSTHLVELPYPVEGKRYPAQGWEHVEFVVASACDNVDDFFNELLALFPLLRSKWDKLASDGVKMKFSSPKGDGERLANPSVAFKWQGVCIKLHPHSLKTVIASESHTQPTS
jgi:predicted metalloenzyme YecM